MRKLLLLNNVRNYLVLLIFCISHTTFSQIQIFNDPNENIGAGGGDTNVFTVPANITSITIEAWGPGGAGATLRKTTGDGYGAGGGGGAYSRSVLAVDPGDTFTIYVGAGAVAEYSFGNGDQGAAARRTYVTDDGTATVVVQADGGRSSVWDNIGTGAAGGLASASIGDFRRSGGQGGTGAADGAALYSAGGAGAGGPNGTGGAGDDAANVQTFGGVGSGGYAGNGGDGVQIDTPNDKGNPGLVGATFGAGGSGAALNSTQNKLGGNGANGGVVISWTTVVFYDSDNDGLSDYLDTDDDNDGLSDTEEDANCTSSLTNVRLANYNFLYEDFGSGTDISEINVNFNSITDYCFEDTDGGDGDKKTAECPYIQIKQLNDGEYTVTDEIRDGIDDDLNNNADDWWYGGGDHTGDTNGRMAVFNGNHESDIVYSATVNGTIPNVEFTFTLWAINLDREGGTFPTSLADRERPDLFVRFLNVDTGLPLTNTLTASNAEFRTGDIPPSDPDNLGTGPNPGQTWYDFNYDFAISESKFRIVIINRSNNTTSGTGEDEGNDFAIDDISISQTVCDLDNDGVADIFDLDSDDDGIPDVYEAKLNAYNNGSGYITLTAGDPVADADGDGRLDAAVTDLLAINLDSDGDGTPDYLDLDSDNDGLYDVDESGATNAGKVGFVNGDGDISGDGTANSSEAEAFRSQDAENDGIVELIGDGILDIFEDPAFDGNYGNQGQSNPVDTDVDGIPDYLDLYSNDPTNNPANGTDFGTSIYAIINPGLDGNNDGLLDDNTDTDGDGIVDAFDTDETVYGSPRDISYDLHIDFDGRNDYIQDASLLGGLAGATTMAWIKIDGASSGIRQIVGQDALQLYVNASNQIEVNANGGTIITSAAVPTDVWIHVAVVQENGANLRLYVNGVERASAAGATINADASLLTVGKHASLDQDYFDGAIDEVKVFDVALSTLELQKVMHQEVYDNGGMVRGETIPLDTNTSWANLLRYYRFDDYKDDVMDDRTTAAIDLAAGATAYNIKTLQVETAPIPFTTTSSGLKTAQAVWTHGDVWEIEDLSQTVANASLGIYNAPIIVVDHDITVSEAVATIGLIINSGVTVNFIESGSGDTAHGSPLYNTWFLQNDGTINFEDESQLIQTATSIYTGTGLIRRGQEGTNNSHVYNYWSSPVSNQAAANNSGAQLSNVLYTKDDKTATGDIVDGITAVTFCNGHSCADNATENVSTRWLYTFANAAFNYANWIKINQNTTIPTGRGYTMKGVYGSGDATNDHPFVFVGRPNNGDINHTIGVENAILLGNPYPSALDADAFISDNIPETSGTLYFWEHWSDGTHYLSEYQGGYGYYNLSGATPPMSHPDITAGGGGSSLGTPGRYVPVGQGFFMRANTVKESFDDPAPFVVTGGTITFSNSHRTFEVEEGNSDSKYFRGEGEEITENLPERIKLEFTSPDGYNRQILLAFIEGASEGYDLGYDGLLESGESFRNDACFMLGNNKLIIQGVGAYESDMEFPLGVKIDKAQAGGVEKIRILDLENIPSDRAILIKDKLTGAYHDLRMGDFEVALDAGEHNDRFALTFARQESAKQTLSVDDLEAQGLTVYLGQGQTTLEVENSSLTKVEAIAIYSIAGQLIENWSGIDSTDEISLPVTLSTGAYIVQITTEEGTESQKVFKR